MRMAGRVAFGACDSVRGFRFGKGEVIMPKKKSRSASKKRVVCEHKLYKTHTGHGKHLCELVRARKMDEVAALSKGAKHVCHICGRAAAKASSLCEPVEI